MIQDVERAEAGAGVDARLGEDRVGRGGEDDEGFFGGSRVSGADLGVEVVSCVVRGRVHEQGE